MREKKTKSTKRTRVSGLQVSSMKDLRHTPVQNGVKQQRGGRRMSSRRKAGETEGKLGGEWNGRV